MDELARRYVLLCLRLERLDAGFVDSYNGPTELREAASGEPPPLATELHDEAMALRADVDALGDRLPAGRRRWLEGQLRAIGALARRAGGEEIAFVDLAEQLCGVRIAPVPEGELLEARRRLADALPGDGDLATRRSAFREDLRVPESAVLGALRASAERFRAATRRDFDLPAVEGIDWEEARDRPWGAYATFTGAGRTRIIINVELPWDVTGIAYLAAHEAYPGHHAEHATKERTLVGAGVGEATMRTMNTPEAMLAEGQADVAREVVMDERELAAELAAIAASVGLSADWRRATEVHLAERVLAGVAANAAVLLQHEGRPQAEVRAWAASIAALDGTWLDHLMRTLTDPVGAAYHFTYAEGARLVRRWLELTGQTAGFARLLSEQLSPAQLLAELEAAESGVAGLP